MIGAWYGTQHDRWLFGKREMTVKDRLDSKIKALPGTSFQQQMGKRKGLLIQVWLKVRCQWIIHIGNYYWFPGLYTSFYKRGFIHFTDSVNLSFL